MPLLRSAFVGLIVLAAGILPARAVEVQRVVSPGGVEAWLVEDHSNPIIALDLAFRGGAALDPAGKAGLANLASGLIDEGAGELDSQAFQALLQNLSIRLSFSAGLDIFSGELTTLTENRETAFDLLRLALTAPRFDPEPVERIRAQILAGLAQQAEDPGWIAGRTMDVLQFPDHPYGRPVTGTAETLAAITRDDLRDFVATRFARDRLAIGVVGDITPEELAVHLDETFLALPAEGVALDVPDVAPAGAGEVVVVQRDVPQSIVQLAHQGIARDDPDYYAAYLVNYLFGGGGFASRLYAEVREKRGLAYSVYSYLNPMDHAALLQGGVATRNGRVGESLEIIRREWRRMAQEGPTAEEVADAKTYLTGSFPLRFSSSGRIAGMLVAMQIEELGIDYLDRRNDLIEAVTLADAQRVARRLYDPDALTVVIVGRPDGVTPSRTPPEIGS
jgi:zinc protease